MDKCEFSETQFVIGFLRELLNRPPLPPYYFLIDAPSTLAEKRYASDLIIKHYGKRFRYSEFFQFKRSHYFNSEIFHDKSGKVEIDTGLTPRYGFNIYNSKKTKQFNVLQSLAKKSRKRVYYCAPLFHTITEYNANFKLRHIEKESKVFDLATPTFQSIRIPLGSTHRIIFDSSTSYICSDPQEVEGVLASERANEEYTKNLAPSESHNLKFEVEEIFSWITETNKDDSYASLLFDVDPNFYDIREFLITYFNIHWFPVFQ